MIWMMAAGYLASAGLHGDLVKKLERPFLDVAEKDIAKALDAEREEERERCAKIAETYRSPYTLKASENGLSVEEIDMQEYVRKEIARAIRAQKQGRRG